MSLLLIVDTMKCLVLSSRRFFWRNIMSSPSARSWLHTARKMPRDSNCLTSAGGCFALLMFLVLLSAGISMDVNAAPPSNDQCFSSEIIPSAGPFPYLTAVSDVKDATTAGDPPVPPEIADTQ